MISPCDLNESFEYSVSSQGVDNRVTETCFERLVRGNGGVQSQDIKLSNCDCNDEDEACVFTQVDDTKLTSLSMKDVDNMVPVHQADIGESGSSVQACVASIFSLGINDLVQNGGLVPRFCEPEQQLEGIMREWLMATKYHFVISYRENSTPLPSVKPGSLCLVYGKSSLSSLHCYVGVVFGKDVRIVHDPCALPGSNIERDVSVTEIQWVGYFIEDNSSLDDMSHTSAKCNTNDNASATNSGIGQHDGCVDVCTQEADKVEWAETVVDFQEDELSPSSPPTQSDNLPLESISGNQESRSLEKNSSPGPESAYDVRPDESASHSRTYPPRARGLLLGFSQSQAQSEQPNGDLKAQLTICTDETNHIRDNSLSACSYPDHSQTLMKLQLGFSQTQPMDTAVDAEQGTEPRASLTDGEHSTNPTHNVPYSSAKSLQLGFSQTPHTDHPSALSSCNMKPPTGPPARCVQLGFSPSQAEGEGKMPRVAVDGEEEDDRDDVVYLSELTANTCSASLSHPSSVVSQLQHTTLCFSGVSQHCEEESRLSTHSQTTGAAAPPALTDARKTISADVSYRPCSDDKDSLPPLSDSADRTCGDWMEYETNCSESMPAAKLPQESRCSDSSDGWITSKSAQRSSVHATAKELSPNQFAPTEEEPGNDDPKPANIPFTEDYAGASRGCDDLSIIPREEDVEVRAMVKRIAAMEQQLRTREAYLDEKEKRLSALEEQVLAKLDCEHSLKPIEHASVSLANETRSNAEEASLTKDNPTLVSIDVKDRRDEKTTVQCEYSADDCMPVRSDGGSNSLSQGGALAVDGLLQLTKGEGKKLCSFYEQEPVPPQNTKMFQWSTLARPQCNRTDSGSNMTPMKRSRLTRKMPGNRLLAVEGGDSANTSPVNVNRARPHIDSTSIGEQNNVDCFEFDGSESPDGNGVGVDKSPTNGGVAISGEKAKKSSSSPICNVQMNTNDEVGEECEWDSQKGPSPTKGISKAVSAERVKLCEDSSKSDTGVSLLDIPSSLSSACDIKCMSWKSLWKELESVGWFWQRGRGLIDFVYCRPGCRYFYGSGKHVNDSVTEGKHCFMSQDDVTKYLLKHAITDAKFDNEKKKNGDGDEAGTLVVPGESTVSSNTVTGADDKNLDSDNHAATLKSQEVPSDGDGKVAGQSDENWRQQVNSMSWAELWLHLSNEGWTWNHGSGLVTTWYMKPGIEKHSKGVVGVSVFTSQEEVRAEVRRSISCDSSPDRLPRDDKHELIEGGEVESWELARHRGKRKLRPKPPLEASPCGSSKAGDKCTGSAQPSSSSSNKKRAIRSARVKRSTGRSRKRQAVAAPEESTQQQVTYEIQSNDCSSTSESESESGSSERGAFLGIACRRHRGIRGKEASATLECEQKQLISRISGKKFRYDEDSSSHCGGDSEVEEVTEKHNGLFPRRGRNGCRRPPQFHGRSFNHGGGVGQSDLRGVRLTSPSSCKVDRPTKDATCTPSSGSNAHNMDNVVLESTPVGTIECMRPALFRVSPSPPRSLYGCTAPVYSTSSTKVRAARYSPSYCSKIFRGVKFFFTGLDETYTPDRAELEAIIKNHGGCVIDFDMMIKIIGKVEDSLKNKVVVLASPTGFRRPNYLVALAAGIVHVHPQWVVDSVDSDSSVDPLPVEHYLLPSGASVHHPYFVFRKQVPPGGVLKQRRVLPFTSPAWTKILESAGALLCDSTDEFLKDCRARLMRQRDTVQVRAMLPMPDIIVVDSFSYAEDTLTSAQLDLIRQCNFILNSRNNSRRERVPQIVSTDWVAHCLEIGELLDETSHDVFTIPSNPVQRPVVFKGKSGERYVVGDAVYYESNAGRIDDLSWRCHDAHTIARSGKRLLVGLVVSFFRKGRGDTVQVKIRPLRVRCRECCCHMPRRKGENHSYELSLDDGIPECILSADKLRHHPAILSHDAYNQVAYASRDGAVYYSAREWESSERHFSEGCCQREIYHTQEIMVQHSQDY